MVKAGVFHHHIADWKLLALQCQQIQPRHNKVAPEYLRDDGVAVKAGSNGVQAFLQDHGDLPFASVATFESVSGLALARGYRRAVEPLHALTACGADANRFRSAAKE